MLSYVTTAFHDRACLTKIVPKSLIISGTSLTQRLSLLCTSFAATEIPGSFQDLLHAITKQLLEQYPEAFDDVKEWYKDRKCRSPETKAITPSEHVSVLKRLCLRFYSVYLVVDALDEAMDPKALVNGLVMLVATFNIKMILTGKRQLSFNELLSPYQGSL